MIRRITLAAALLMGACGDDSKPTPKEDAGTGPHVGNEDAGTMGNGSDAGPPVTPNVVTNVGEACRSANACMGERPACQTMLSLLGQEVPFPAGYCSAPCTDNRECGADGECPVGESLKTVPATFRSLIGGAAPSNCYQRCTSNVDCRTSENYRCATIVSALSEGAGGAGLSLGPINIADLLSGPIVDSKYCLPPAPELPDAGPSTDAGASDAGASDASSDAGGDATSDV